MLSNKPFLLKSFLLLVSIETAWTVFMLISISSDSKNALLFGLSFARLVLISVVIAIFLFAFFSLVYVLTSHLRLQKIINAVSEMSERQSLSFLVWFLVVVLFLGVAFLLTPSQRIGDAIYERLFPIVLLGIILSAQTLLFQFAWLGKKLNFNFLFQWKTAYLTAGFTFVVVFFSWLLITWSKIGIVPEKTGWSPPGTPVLPQQAFIALGIGFFFYLITKPWEWITNLKKSDLAIGIALWLLASFLWLNEPLRDWSYFTAKPTPPNFEIYPYSDAALYDTFAQNYIIGTSVQYGLIHRPGYAIFLAFLHAVIGQDYDSAIFAQILFLAVGPVALYFLVSQLGGRPAGIIAALILIFREKNAIALTNIIEVSHSKLFMSDVPTMILTITFTYFLIHWLKHEENKLYVGVIAGAFLGLAALIRSQSLIIIPIVFICIFIAKRKTLKLAFIQTAMFLLGVIIVTLPWMLRNHQIAGRMVIEYQPFYTTVIASGYTDNPTDIEKLPNETIQQYDDRMFSMILNYMRENPLEVARFYTAYFVHNEISSIVYLPMSLNFLDARSYVRELNMWGWNPPFASPSPKILPFFFITLCVIALGIGIAYQRAKWIGLLPLFIHLGYSLSVVPFKTSGWRFILPVDWVLTLYFSIGLMHLTLMIFSLFNNVSKKIENTKSISTQLNYQKTIPVLSIFLIIGLAFPLVEKAIPQKYPALSSSELIQTYFAEDIILENGEAITPSDLTKFLEAEPNSTVLYGRALYPSFYKSGEFWGDDDSYPLEMRDISRLQFLLIGPAQRQIYIPLTSSPNFFPHSADVIVVGCKTKTGGVQALLVKINDKDFVYKTPWLGLTCDSQ
jgi:hypothetical protein